MCSVAEFETLSTAECMWFPGVCLSDVSVSFRCRLLMKFQVPLTDYGNCIRNQPNEVAILSNIGKTYFYTKRDTCREKHRILQLRLQLR